MGVGSEQPSTKPGPLAWAELQWGSQMPCPWAVTAVGRWAGSGPGMSRGPHMQWIKQLPLQPLCPAPLGKEGAWSCTPVWRLQMTMLGGLLLPISSRMKQFPGKQQTVKVERHMRKEAVYPSSADQQTDPTAHYKPPLEQDQNPVFCHLSPKKQNAFVPLG